MGASLPRQSASVVFADFLADSNTADVTLAEVPDDASSAEEVEAEELFSALEHTDYGEDEVRAVFAELTQRKRTWKQAKQLRASQKAQRGYHAPSSASSS